MFPLQEKTRNYHFIKIESNSFDTIFLECDPQETKDNSFLS